MHRSLLKLWWRNWCANMVYLDQWLVTVALSSLAIFVLTMQKKMSSKLKFVTSRSSKWRLSWRHQPNPRTLSRALISKISKQWENLLPYYEFSYKWVPHKATKLSLFAIIYGCSPNTLMDFCGVHQVQWRSRCPHNWDQMVTRTCLTKYCKIWMKR